MGDSRHSLQCITCSAKSRKNLHTKYELLQVPQNGFRLLLTQYCPRKNRLTQRPVKYARGEILHPWGYRKIQGLAFPRYHRLSRPLPIQIHTMDHECGNRCFVAICVKILLLAAHATRKEFHVKHGLQMLAMSTHLYPFIGQTGPEGEQSARSF